MCVGGTTGEYPGILSILDTGPGVSVGRQLGRIPGIPGYLISILGTRVGIWPDVHLYV